MSVSTVGTLASGFCSLRLFSYVAHENSYMGMHLYPPFSCVGFPLEIEVRSFWSPSPESDARRISDLAFQMDEYICDTT